MTRLETLKARLETFEARYDQLLLEPQVTQFAHSLGGQSSTTMQALDTDKLKIRIEELKIEISRLEGRGGRAIMVRTEW